MNYALAVSDGQGAGDLSGKGTGPGKRHTALFEDFLQRLALDEFHYKIRRLRRLIHAHVVEGNDCGVRDLPDYAGFLHETLARFALRKLFGEQFDSDDARDQGIKSARDAAVGANADDFQDFVPADFQDGEPPACLLLCHKE